MRLSVPAETATRLSRRCKRRELYRAGSFRFAVKYCFQEKRATAVVAVYIQGRCSPLWSRAAPVSADILQKTRAWRLGRETSRRASPRGRFPDETSRWKRIPIISSRARSAALTRFAENKSYQTGQRRRRARARARALHDARFDMYARASSYELAR